MSRQTIVTWCKEHPTFVAAFSIKFFLGLWFSSEYKDLLFVPFLTEYLSSFGNPWATFFAHPTTAEFPYHPIMLYIMSVFYAPVAWLNISNGIASNFFFKLPLLLSDISITATLLGFFPHHKRNVFLFYVLSPIVFYASYLHGQLDIITTAIFMASLFALYHRKFTQSGSLLGLALGTKLHIIIGIPLLALFIIKKYSIQPLIRFLVSCFSVYALVTIPYLFSPGFAELVLNNPKQSMMLDATINLSGTYSIYTSVAIVLLVIARFGMYKKTNMDLLFSFFAILFSIPVLLVLPRPGWYVWAVPFISIFLITSTTRRRESITLYAGFNTIFCIFFLFFYKSEIAPLTWFGTQIPPAITSETLRNLAFTGLEISLLAMILAFYQFGVRSNAIYQRSQSIILGIGGDSGSGKTTLLSDITDLMTDKTVALETDGIHKWERGNKEWETHTHLDPKANHLHTFSQSLAQLKRGEAAPFRFYKHDDGTFTQPENIKSNDIILLSGLHPFYLPVMRKLVDIKLFLATQEELRCFWKIKRDTTKRGYSIESVQAQLKKREEESLKHIATQKQFADIIIEYFTEDSVTDYSKEIDEITLKLRITCSSDLYLDNLISIAQKNSVLDRWDYLDNLQYITMEFNGSLSGETFEKLAKLSIENINEIVTPGAKWQSGYRGLIQYIIISYISKELKHHD